MGAWLSNIWWATSYDGAGAPLPDISPAAAGAVQGPSKPICEHFDSRSSLISTYLCCWMCGAYPPRPTPRRILDGETFLRVCDHRFVLLSELNSVARAIGNFKPSDKQPLQAILSVFSRSGTYRISAILLYFTNTPSRTPRSRAVCRTLVQGLGRRAVGQPFPEALVRPLRRPEARHLPPAPGHVSPRIPNSGRLTASRWRDDDR
jgi:hypothetical protein